MIVGVQYLRAYAALLVVFFHAAVNGDSTVVFGGSGVDVFFVLSGFLMWKVTSHETRPGAFMLNRIQRIVPIYWLATLTVFACAVLGITGSIQPDPAYLASSLAFLPYRAAEHLYPMLIVGWTLNLEMFFYAVFALAIWLLPRKYVPLAMTALFTGLVALRPLDPVIAFYANPMILEFIAGIWIAVLSTKLPGRLAGSALLLLGIVGTVAGGGLPREIGYGIPAILCVIGVLAIERDDATPNLPLLRLLGDASYSIYVWHSFAIAAMAPALAGGPFATLVLFSAGVVFGLGGYYVFERPVLDLMKRLKSRRPAPRAG